MIITTKYKCYLFYSKIKIDIDVSGCLGIAADDVGFIYSHILDVLIILIATIGFDLWKLPIAWSVYLFRKSSSYLLCKIYVDIILDVI
jgi:hypothetical protein